MKEEGFRGRWEVREGGEGAGGAGGVVKGGQVGREVRS